MKMNQGGPARGTPIRRPGAFGMLGLAASAMAGLIAIGGCMTAPALTGGAPGAMRASEAANAALSCDDGLRTALRDQSDITVLTVKSFRQGEPVVLAPSQASAQATSVEGGAAATPPVAGVDLCLVKLLVGPGNPGPADAPSTSAGIGIEILLPAHEQWNRRIRVYGNSGWAGTSQASLTAVASDDLHLAAVARGFVVATSDHGHVGSPIDPSWAMSPDGGLNRVGWADFSERSLHELAEKTKLVARLYYAQPHQYAYWDGFSTGGRQGLKLAQAFPDDFDGILVGAPAINWSRYHTANLYGPVAMQQDLGATISPAKLDAVSRAALEACGGAGLGFLIDPLACRYDPASDPRLLCPSAAGTSSADTARVCLTAEEARLVNKLWYGQTVDGSVPEPAADNGSSSQLTGSRLWFGWTRGTDLATTSAGEAPGIILAADQTALELQTPGLGSAQLRNATGNGANGWRSALDYSGLAQAQARGVALQPEFSDINTDNPDLARFAASGGRLLMYHGLADEYIPVQGSINYYSRAAETAGGFERLQTFYRFYLVPGFTHSGRSEGKPSVPVPQPASGRDEMFTALQNWVENNEPPATIEATSADGAVSLPLCVFPLQTAYRGSGLITSATSYECRRSGD